MGSDGALVRATGLEIGGGGVAINGLPNVRGLGGIRPPSADATLGGASASMREDVVAGPTGRGNTGCVKIRGVLEWTREFVFEAWTGFDSSGLGAGPIIVSFQ